MSTSTSRSWRELVEEIDDKDRNEKTLHPVVYFFSNGVLKKDSGPQSGIYDPNK